MLVHLLTDFLGLLMNDPRTESILSRDFLGFLVDFRFSTVPVAQNCLTHLHMLRLSVAGVFFYLRKRLWAATVESPFLTNSTIMPSLQ